MIFNVSTVDSLPPFAPGVSVRFAVESEKLPVELPVFWIVTSPVFTSPGNMLTAEKDAPVEVALSVPEVNVLPATDDELVKAPKTNKAPTTAMTSTSRASSQRMMFRLSQLTRSLVETSSLVGETAVVPGPGSSVLILTPYNRY